ncbi:MAG TPA: lasso peptide biosynthesis B2 protein [Longimicrobiales bacterium]
MIGSAGVWLRRARRITARDVRLLAEAQYFLLACQFERWRRPLGELFRRAGPEPTRPGASRADWRAARSVAWAVTRAAAYGIFRPHCLVRSMAIQRMLRRRGITSANLNIGVRTRGGAFEAHAWVELDGVVIGDSREHVQTFTRVMDLRVVGF